MHSAGPQLKHPHLTSRKPFHLPKQTPHSWLCPHPHLHPSASLFPSPDHSQGSESYVLGFPLLPQTQEPLLHGLALAARLGPAESIGFMNKSCATISLYRWENCGPGRGPQEPLAHMRGWGALEQGRRAPQVLGWKETCV